MATQNTTRPYTTVKIVFVPQSIKTLNITAKRDFTIEGTNGGSVAIRAGERFTVIRSDSLGPDMWYIVRHVKGEKKCSCPATKPCKHEKAVQGLVVVVPMKRELRVVISGKTFYLPQYREPNADWAFFKDEEGKEISFCMVKDLAYQFIREDSDANRAQVQARYGQVLAARSEETRAWVKARAEKNLQIPVKTDPKVSVSPKGRTSLKNPEAQSAFFMTPECSEEVKGTIQEAQKQVLTKMRKTAQMEMPADIDWWSREQAEDEIARLAGRARGENDLACSSLGPRRGFSILRV